MIFFVGPATVLNRGRLEIGRAPRKLLGLGLGPVPRGLALRAAFWRVLLESPLLRYSAILSPFLLLLAVMPDSALGVSQAPLLMAALVIFVETYVLAIPDPERRRALIDPSDAAKGLDRLTLRAKSALTEIAAARGVAEGSLVLVVEQSELWRAPPLTLISLQRPASEETTEPGFMDLSTEEQTMVRARLFDEALSEARLHRINTAQAQWLRMISLEARSVSAHARLAALAAQKG